MDHRHVVRKSLGGNVYLGSAKLMIYMRVFVKILVGGIVLLSLAACGTVSKLDVATQDPSEVEDRAVVDGKVLPLPDESIIVATPLNEGPESSPVVKRLVSSARSQSEQADFDGAAGSLERALRIEPRNAMLWARLADVRYAQEAWRKAIQLAAKSNTLVGNNSDLRRRNWYLMANAYQVLGDETSAQKFRSKLGR